MSTFHDPLIALHELTVGLLAEDNPDVLLNAILDQAIQNTGADSGSIALLDDTRSFLQIRAFRGLEGDVPEKVKLKLGEGVTGRCILTGKIRNVGDTSQDPYYVSVRADICSELAIPLTTGKKSFGVISVDSSRKNAFTRQHEEYLNLLGNYAAQIFTHQEGIRRLSHRQYIQDLLIEISSFLGHEPDFKTVFEGTITLLEKKIGLLRAAVYLHEETSGELNMIYSLNFSETERSRSHYLPGEGITGGVFTNKKAVHIADIESDSAFLNKAGISRPALQASFFSTPIVVNNEAVGVFNMELPYTSQSVFEDYIFFAQIVATLFSQAINIKNLIEQQRAEITSENVFLKRQFDSVYTFENIAGKSPVMQQMFNIMKMSADSPSSILLLGESGTGKELIATAIHNNSVRKNKNLVKINCAAIPADLLESELFGYAKGAFTGAESEHKGKFLYAHEGTLFLDEIGEMDIKLQSKLLRFLQEKEFSPLGSNSVHKVDVRIIAATNANLEEMVAEKKFREDLFYRLNVIRINIPPLRERMEDLPFLTSHILKKIAQAGNKPEKKLSEKAYSLLESYDFPGNIRELENTIERAAVLSQGTTIEADEIHLPSKRPLTEPAGAQSQATPATSELPAEGFELKDWIKARLLNFEEGDYYKNIVSAVEKELLLQVLSSTFYNKSKTARLLGVNRLTLDKKIKDLQILNS